MCVLVILNVNVKVRVYLHAALAEEHCSLAQCAALTFQLHLSACTKAFLRALTCVDLLLVWRDSGVLCGTRVGGQPA